MYLLILINCSSYINRKGMVINYMAYKLQHITQRDDDDDIKGINNVISHTLIEYPLKLSDLLLKCFVLIYTQKNSIESLRQNDHN